ncbi:MAG: CHAT domain-containing protein [Moorea sp. SIO1G6]|uniref:CHAT domain-containing protein n=1 Tax=Moorena sp. SIO1G6 TaxID=2607840 RepID=UPI0013BFB060|nr:CHAT domain-containing protein [Moorena sp. SIO1G6]NET65727.1 CHAT domain-containing protein [Moorena sp. SIO1G6]
MSQIKLAVSQISQSLAAVSLLVAHIGVMPTQAQIKADDSTPTQVTSDGNQFDIDGGIRSGDNIFHSFEEFGLDQDQIANFLSQPGIKNILSRVTSRNASVINGLIKITGEGNPNLFLMNPAGIIFGANSQLDVPGSFTATTATSIGFGDENWFNAFGDNDYSTLDGTPSAFAFGTSETPGLIFNEGKLEVAAGNNLTLIGGTVINTTELELPEGTITIATVPGGSLVKISQEGSLLNLEVEPLPSDPSRPEQSFTPLSLPKLLTGDGVSHGTEFTDNGDNTVTLTSSGITVAPGDVTVKDLKAQTAFLSANNNLTLRESQLSSTGDLTLLAKETVLIRDTPENSFQAVAGGNLKIQGDGGIKINQDGTIERYGGIDIQALKNPNTRFQSGGNLTLVSDGKISTDAHFASGGNFSIENLAGEPGDFVSLQDPIITADGDVTFGDYTGSSLKVESTGNIEGGNIKITAPDTGLADLDPDSASDIGQSDINTLRSSRAVILRAGLTQDELTNQVTDNSGDASSNQVPGNSGDASSNQVTDNKAGDSSLGSITIGNIDTSNPNNGRDNNAAGIENNNAGPVILSAQGDIIFRNSDPSNLFTQIRTTERNGNNSGNVFLETKNGSIKIEAARLDIITEVSGGGNAGKVTFQVPNLKNILDNIDSEKLQINTSGRDGGNAGDIEFVSQEQFTSEQQQNIEKGIQAVLDVSGGGKAGKLRFSRSPESETNPDPGPELIDPDPELIDPGPELIDPGPELIDPGPELIDPGPELIDPDPGPDPIEPGPDPIEPEPDPIEPEPDPIEPETDPIEPGPDTKTILDTDSETSPETSESNGGKSGNDTPVSPSDKTAISDIQESSSEEVSPESDPVYLIEEAFTKEYESHFKRPFKTKINTQNDVRNRTRELERETGLKTAVIYVSFVENSSTLPGTRCQTPSIPVAKIDRRFGYRLSEVPQAPERCLPQANDQLELLVITAEGNPILRRINGASRDQVLAVTNRFQRSLSNPHSLDAKGHLNQAEQLYQWIIAPLQKELNDRKIQSLIFAMDQGLRSLPIAAIYDGQQYLVEKYGVNLVPSLSLTYSRHTDVRPFRVLAMGASKFPYQQPLPGVEVELTTITETLWKGRSFLNEAFTLENLMAQRQQRQYGIIHLATHAEFNSGTPNNSYIQMWNRKLRLYEMKNLLYEPSVELLVLSACRTALGNREAELGFAGSAFQAGVDSTLATLWYVSDQGALGLTTEFYRQLRKTSSKSEALRQAQLAMIQGNVRIENNQLYGSGKNISLPPELSGPGKQSFSHPYYWAAFTLVGDP